MHGETAGLTAHGGCGCEFHKLLNDVCDPECRGEACFNDNGACTRVQVGCPGCEDAWLNDGVCDDECQTQACGWDMGDCVFANGSLVTPQKERCTRSCPASWVNDGECDPACNVETCNFDGGDCAPTPCAYTAPRSKSWCVLGGPSNARVPRAATTRRLSPPASLPPCRRRFDLGAFDAHALELPLATLAPHLASNPALAGKDGRVSLRVCTQTDLATLCEGADTPATLRGAAAALSFVAPGARCVTQSLGALKDKRVGLIARAHGDTTTPAGVNLSFYNGSACGNERSPRIERGGRIIRASVHFVLMCEPSALSPELVSWTHTEATCSWEFGFRYAGGCAVEKSEAKFGECAAGCLPSWVGDRTCDRACNVTECEYDGGDCIDDAHLCAAKCPSEWLGDGVCDAECATVACDHDGGGECRCQLHVHLLIHLLIHLHLRLHLHIRLRLRLRLLASTPAAAPASRLPLDD